MFTMFFNMIFLISTFLLFIDTRAWSFSNLLMAGSQATLSFADTVAIGAQKGLEECARQFTYERWSCPEMTFANVLQNNLPANREIAFVQAVVSAGIVHTVTRNCSLGHLDNCRCDSSRRDKRSDSGKNGFRWGGCSDNIELGSQIAITFLDKREIGHDAKALINLHNNEVGRNAVRETMIKVCKCHGVSGSCSMQTCWRKINDFQAIGNYLKRAYKRAVKIESNNNNIGMGIGMTTSNDVFDVKSTNKNMLSIAANKLAFSEESPNYCLANSTIGSNGTFGRICSQRKGKNVTKEERRSCKKLCKQCGFKVKKEKKRVITSCNCKFKFCCKVECQRCIKDELSLTCGL